MDRPSPRVNINHFAPLQIVGYLLRIENLLLLTPFVVFWSFLMMNIVALGGTAGTFVVVRAVMGLFLSFALYFCYLMVVLDYTTRGYQQPPKISGDLISESKSKFFKAVLALSTFFSLTMTLGGEYGLWFMIGLSALVLPVVLAIIAIQDSFIHAMNPWNWLVFFSAVRWDVFMFKYLLCYCLLIASLFWVTNTSSFTTVLPAVAAATLMGLALFRTIGILVHANAEALGLPVRFSSDIEQAQRNKQAEQDESEFAAHLYRLSEADRSELAFKQYKQYIEQHGLSAAQRLWPVISDWSNPSLSLLAGQLYIEQLVSEQRYREAWPVLLKCSQRNGGEFKLLSARSTLMLCDRVETHQEKTVAADLLSFFAQDFPNHPKISEASLRAAEYLVDLDQMEEAKKRLKQLRIKYPHLTKQPTFQRLLELVGK